MKVLIAATIAALGLVSAATASAGDTNYAVTVASDYVDRGVSQTDQHEAVQARVEHTFDNTVYVGAFASNVDFNNSTDAEINLYAGVRPSYKEYTFDFAVIYTGYPDQPKGSDYAYGEIKAGVSRPVGKANVGAAVYYSPQFFGETGKAFYYEVNASYPLTNRLTVSGALGEQSFQQSSYNTGNIGVSYKLNDRLSVDVRYHDTNTQIEPDHTVLSLTASF
jgi:uncharacterized protein (TIGR02001 family)